MGMEVGLLFTKVGRTTIEGFSRGDCSDCKQDLNLSIMMVIKSRIRIGRWLALYPLFGGGFGLIENRFQEADDNQDWVGISITTGLGIEFNVNKHFWPFVELRYWLLVGLRNELDTTTDIDHRLMYHLFALGIGIRA